MKPFWCILGERQLFSESEVLQLVEFHQRKNYIQDAVVLKTSCVAITCKGFIHVLHIIVGKMDKQGKNRVRERDDSDE